MRLELERWMQDIIMGTKDYYSLNKDETNLDRMKRITQSIHGGCGEEYLSTVNHWLYRTYDELRNYRETSMSKSNLQKFILGETYDQRENDEGAQMNAFKFLYGEISLCTVHDGDFDLVLTINDELAYESDYIRQERKNYSIDYISDGSKTISLSFNGEVIKTVAQGVDFEGYSLLCDLEEKMATETVRNQIK